MNPRFPAWLGAFAGLALALSGALAPLSCGGAEATEAAARVNGAPIPAAALDAALRRAAPAPGHEAAARAALRERLVDEELLVQRAVEVELVGSDRNLRKLLARAAIDAALARAAVPEPTPAELRAFFHAHEELFAAPALARVRCVRFEDGAGSDALQRARAAAAAVASGASFDAATAEAASACAAAAPDALLPEASLRRQLGPALAGAALALAPGAVSAPVRTPAGVHLLALLERRPAQRPSFESVQREVRRELLRRRGDDALRGLLAELRASAQLVYAARAPRP